MSHWIRKPLRGFLLTFYLLLIGFSASAAESRQIVIPKLDVKIDPNEQYVRELLQQILEHAPRAYTVVNSQGRMLQGRSIYEMTKPDGNIDIMWSMTTDVREKQLIPIRIPLDKGLIGWRINLITEKNRKSFSAIKKVRDLRSFTAGQGIDWPDVDILKSNQLRVLTSNSYDPLFSMLAGGRFDYFPRSVFEILGDFANYPEHKIEVEQSFILHYQTACYFFVTQKRPQLAEDIRKGFEKIIANGIFEQLFQKHNKVSIEKANIKQRTIIHLRNPLLTPNSLPLNRAELWFRP